MGVSNKYRTFDQLLEDVSVDFSSYALEGMIEPQQLIKVATRVNYDLGLRIHRTKEAIIDIEHNKGMLPTDFAYLNHAFICSDFNVINTMPSGTHIDTTNPVPYVPEPYLITIPIVYIAMVFLTNRLLLLAFKKIKK